jgi:hypothetical protein
MIAGTYLLSGASLMVTAYLFNEGVLTALTQTIAWCVIFFFASSGASAAYLTVSEIFPLEVRWHHAQIRSAVAEGRTRPRALSPLAQPFLTACPIPFLRCAPKAKGPDSRDRRRVAGLRPARKTSYVGRRLHGDVIAHAATVGWDPGAAVPGGNAPLPVANFAVFLFYELPHFNMGLAP